jgi:hypothetical protein
MKGLHGKPICDLVVFLFALGVSWAAVCVTEDFNTSLDPSDWRLYGSATHFLSKNGGYIQLTPDENDQVSSIFYLKPINTGHFTATFDVYLGSHDGADGVVFAFVEKPGIGLGGGQMGFLTGLEGYGIEFDTYGARSGTPGNQPDTENHVGVSMAEPGTSPGKGFAFYQNDNLPYDLENGTWFSAEVEFRSGHVLMWMWNNSVGWTRALVIDYVIPGWKDYDAYLGFTAATGEATNRQLVDNVTFSALTPKPVKTWYVDDSVSSSGDGTSWATAFKTIQEGIKAASDGDIVNVATGTYRENILFKGKNITLRSTNPIDPATVANTSIDGGNAGSTVTFAGTEDESCVLSGFSIGNGQATSGGGICGGTSGQHTRATIRNCVISSNTATDDSTTDFGGGGIAFCDGPILNNRITSNRVFDPSPIWVWGDGGGLFQCNGTVKENSITNNDAEYHGGGLAACGGTISDNTIAQNSANDGGGLYQCHGAIQNNAISQNSAFYGAGLDTCNGTVQNNTITGNQANRDGGGLYYCAGRIRDNTITENNADQYGGGLFRCDDFIENNIIVANTAGFGGGLDECDGYMFSNLIARNSAENSGGGVANCAGEYSNNTIADNSAGRGGGLADCDGTVRNCIVWGNTAPTGPQIAGGSPIVGYSCIQGWPEGGTNTNDNPNFMDPDGPDNDPGTYNDNDYRLKPNSPCIDAGQNRAWMVTAVDLDGNPRILNGRYSDTVDMGAYEYVLFDFRLQKVEQIGGGKIRLTWTSRPDTSYGIDTSSDLRVWTWSGVVVPASGAGTTTWTDTITGSRRFYQVQLY